MSKRTTDPTNLSVQFNARIPFYLRETLVEAAAQRRISQSELVRQALMRELAPELRRQSRDSAPAPS